MPSRNELVARANVVGITASSYPNDSKLEGKVLYMEKHATAQTGVISTTTLTSDATAVTDTDTVTIGNKVYTAKTALTETAASSTLTSDATAPADGDFVHIDGVTYVFRTTLSSPAVANEVLIGVSAATALDNIKSAITLTGTIGTDYSTGTVLHPTVTATTNTDTTQLVVAEAVGLAGNSILTSETSAHLSWTGAALSGGLEPVANEVLIGSTSDGSAFLTNLKKAITDSGTIGTHYSTGTAEHDMVTATTLTSTTLLINSKDFAIQNGAIATTEASSHLSFTSTVMASGVSKVITPAAGTTGGADGLSGDKNYK